MMNEKANRLLAEIRAFTVELSNEEWAQQDCERLVLMIDVFRQMRADGAPDYPIVEYVNKRNGAASLGDSPNYTCTRCNPDEPDPDIECCEECREEYNETEH